MSLLRPDAATTLRQWAEPAAAVVGLGAGLWLIRLGGYFLVPLGGLVMVLAGAWLIQSLRRLRFFAPDEVPGVVELVEGRLGYLGPTFGGYVALPELTEVRLVTLYGKKHWRLKQADGQALLVPHGASGAEVLFDAFATLPDADMHAFSQAVSRPGANITVWRRPARLPLT